MEITGEELTSLLRDNYTAVLLVCDTKTGIPETFYSAKGSLGEALLLFGLGVENLFGKNHKF